MFRRAALIISSFNFEIFPFFYYLVQGRVPAVVISSPSRLRHFLVQFSSHMVLPLFFKGVLPISLISFFHRFPLFLKPPCEAILSPESLCLCTIYP